MPGSGVFGISKISIRPLAVLLVLVVMPVVQAQSYGYRKQEDPLIKGVKEAIGFARSSDRVALDRVVVSLRWQVDELKLDVKVDLDPVLRGALESGKSRNIAYALTQLVFQAMRQKFYWNLDEQLSKHVEARARLDAAQFYYEEILSHAVRRADKAADTERHRKILRSFRDLRPTLGSAGLFGAGRRAPKVEEFRRISRSIETLLREVYTDFLASPVAKENSKEGGSAGGADDDRGKNSGKEDSKKNDGRNP